jgi:DNA-binding transcriptional LysR family regulator
MDRLTTIDAFVRVADLGSFSAAAKAMRSTQSNVSKHVAALEAYLGGRLLERSARSVSLTEQGRRYYAHAIEILHSVERARQQFADAREAISGTIRVAASHAFGRSQIVPALPGLLARHPNLNVDLCLSDRSVDLVREGIDLSFRVANLKDSDLIARRVGSAARRAVASPSYLAQHGNPQSPAELARHQCIHFAGINAPRIWKLRDGRESVVVPVKGRLSIDASDAIREAAVHGLGIALLPEWVLRNDIDEGRLVVVLEKFQPPPLPVYAVMPRRARGSAMTRATVEHMCAHFQKTFRDE